MLRSSTCPLLAGSSPLRGWLRPSPPARGALSVAHSCQPPPALAVWGCHSPPRWGRAVRALFSAHPFLSAPLCFCVMGSQRFPIGAVARCLPAVPPCRVPATCGHLFSATALRYATPSFTPLKHTHHEKSPTSPLPFCVVGLRPPMRVNARYARKPRL